MWWKTVLVLCCISTCSSQDTRILQRMVERLQRHEFRSQQVGEQTLQVLSRLDETQGTQGTSITSLTNMLMRIETRITNIENGMKQEAEVERIRNNKLQESIDAINTKLDSVMSVDQGNKVLRRFNKKMNELSEEMGNHMQTAEIKLQALNANISEGLTHLTQEVVQGESDNAVNLQDVTVQVGNLARQRTAEAESFRQFLATFQETLNQLTTFNHPTGASEAVPGPMTEQTAEVLGALTTKSTHIENMLNELNVKLKTVAYQAEVYNNETLQKVESIRAQSNQGIAEKLDEISSVQLVVKNTLANSAGFTETIWEEVNGVLSELVDKMAGIAKLEKVVVDSADLGLDTKRLLEYGVQQILLEVEDMINVRTNGLDQSIQLNLEQFSRTILTNQTIGLSNMTEELDGEISRVWRQINFMYSTLSDSQSVLQTVENQTKVYVNDSLNKVENMDGQVGQVLTRMVDVEENLNYLLKHLSYIVSDFNKMKGVLGEQFENIRSEFASVYSKLAGNDTEVVDDGPERKGPIPIEDDNQISNNVLDD